MSNLNEREEHTFTPQINKRPSYLNSQNSVSNEMDDPDKLDSFEQPLPGYRTSSSEVKNGNVNSSIHSHNLLSSDREEYTSLKYDADNFKSQFMKSMVSPQNQNSRNDSNIKYTENEINDTFMSQLRSDHGRIAGPGWNNDTNMIGNDSALTIPTKKKSPRSRNDASSNSNNSNSNSNSDIIAPRKSLIDLQSPGYPLNSSTSINNPKSRLSLLKSKLQTLKSPGSHTSSVNNNFHNPTHEDRSIILKSAPMNKSSPLLPSVDSYPNSASTNTLTRASSHNPSGGNFGSQYHHFESNSERRITKPDDKYSNARVENGMDRSINRSSPNVATGSGKLQLNINQIPSTTPNNSFSEDRLNTSRSVGESIHRQDHKNSTRKLSTHSSSAVTSNQLNQQSNSGKQFESPRIRDRVSPRYHQEDDDNNNGNNGNEEDMYGQEMGESQECPDCGRKFNLVSFQKHSKICAKVFQKSRKVFDSSKKRIQDNPELLKILVQKQKEEKMITNKNKKSLTQQEQFIKTNEQKAKWKKDSEAFRQAMKAARQATQAVAEGKPLPPPIISAPDPSLILCPHCGRRFNEKAAERHIPKCSEIRAKPTMLKRGGGGGGGVKGSIAATVKTPSKGRF